MGKKKELALGYGASAHLAYWHAQDFKDAADAIYQIIQMITLSLKANVLASGVSVNMDSGEVRDDWENSWNIYEYINGNGM